MPTIGFTVPELESKLRRKERRQPFRPEAYIEREKLRESFAGGLPVAIYLRDERIGEVKIDSIERITAQDLGEDDVRIEGFANYEQMVRTMKQKGIYPSTDRKMFRIRFHWV